MSLLSYFPTLFCSSADGTLSPSPACYAPPPELDVSTAQSVAESRHMSSRVCTHYACTPHNAYVTIDHRACCSVCNLHTNVPGYPTPPRHPIHSFVRPHIPGNLRLSLSVAATTSSDYKFPPPIFSVGELDQRDNAARDRAESDRGLYVWPCPSNELEL
ncbi:hypothetical protein BDY19DRAFT_924118 [Irpex rosettiformis]|uniref:Uncharacterized protein n=1 Tax=Irpex rosettiformis TaxID=378272 RepID=A0ACB8UDN6_9APHY|nr:hypothetical protein BDY19DRAFT_924118 [Irpex rosettiformis]